ncbi:MAG: WecB/TagA/CpsF family glycosyltransferase [Vampirovibrionales bacterium]|nr:WecB/TagA/CpsF family glycosyltransferase [Vampirovibrionales bacterium]
MATLEASAVQPFPHRVEIESIAIDAFADVPSLFERLLYEINRPKQSFFSAVNIQIMNTAYHEPDIRDFLQQSKVVYCDGAGVVSASKLLHPKEYAITQRVTAADWLFELFEYLNEHGKTVYYLGGEPGIVEKALAIYQSRKPGVPCPVIGFHHGYILKDPQLEQRVIEDINRLSPDLLIVAMGCPLQERWIQQNAGKLSVSVLYPIGATLDYLTEKVQRCPKWMGENGLEWIWRLALEPKRMFRRYVLGNPYFMARVWLNVLSIRTGGGKPKVHQPLIN